MIVINLLIAFLLPTVVGFLTTAIILQGEREMSFYEFLFFGYGLGMGLLSFSMFLNGLLKLPFSIFSVSVLPAVLMLALLFLAARSNIFKSLFETAISSSDLKSLGRWKLLGISLMVLWLTAKILFVLYEGFSRPLFSWDAWSDWSGGAKFFFYERGLNLDPSDEHFFGKGYRRYLGQPLLSPLLQVWIALWAGEFHEIFIKAWAPFYFISLIGLFFFAVKRDSSFIPALIATLLLSSAPLLTYHATDGLADLPEGYYIFAGTLTFWRYLGSKNNRFLLLCGLFFGMSIFTKNEGLLYTVIACISLCLFIIKEKRGWSELIHFSAPALLFTGPWLIFKMVYGLGFGHGDEFSRLGWEQTLHFEVFGIVFKEVFFSANHNLIFAFLVALTFLGIRIISTTNVKYIYLIALLAIPAYLFIYVATKDHHIAVTSLTGFHRNILTFLPVAFFIAALIACRLLRYTAMQNRVS